MEPVYETSFALRAPDADFCAAWRPGAIFTTMQELGEAHSVRLNAGYFALREKGLAWVITRALLVIDRAPVIGETIRARTWTGKARHAIYPRYYLFEDQNGKPLARASSLWVLMDISAREMVSGEKFGLPSFDMPPLPPPVENPGGVVRLEGAEYRTEQPVAYSDLDINLHVNNARYVDWLCDRFPYEWHERYRLERLTVHFASETRPDEALETVLTTQDSSFTFSGGWDGKAHFLMSGQFVKR
jgi:acyl-ACP thioesterase